ncbi:hypothetical protein HPB52_025693 [Rhipicephalus sanguineus]|uniref:Uncharacterized protein n=1 Tax=Rhipicephalus sanguineus TaxID=34632 RepID=A0A9D4TCT0_RHISA|nr:hypothetical protein HPB52_025693 [Rhipicephalus sanguineus]
MSRRKDYRGPADRQAGRGLIAVVLLPLCFLHNRGIGRKRRPSASEDADTMDDCMAAMVLMRLSCSPKSPRVPSDAPGRGRGGPHLDAAGGTVTGRCSGGQRALVATVLRQ